MISAWTHLVTRHPVRGAAPFSVRRRHGIFRPLSRLNQDPASAVQRLVALHCARDDGLGGYGFASAARIAVLASLMVFLTALMAQPASAEPRHGLSIFGDLKYPADFKHFDYVNPDAPKGGKVSQVGPGSVTTFDSFNPYILMGDAAQGLDLLFDSLMVRAADEPDAVYGLVARTADVAPDGRAVTFALRPEAKFADGTPITADDVVFSFETLKSKGHPAISQPLRDVTKAEALGPLEVRYTFTGDLIRDLPIRVALLPVLSKAYFSAREFDKSSLDIPLGSGPYRLKEYRPGTFVAYERRQDYWAADLPVTRGQYNFDLIRYEYFRDRKAELENLFNGTIDFREEFTSVDWATGYNKQVVRDGRVKRMTIPDESPSGAQGFFMNTRRPVLADVRVRKALGLVFDFEWSNKNLFYQLYTRTTSYFDNSDMKAVGLPSPAELALLEPYRDKLPPEVFGEPFLPPVTDGSGNNRENLRKARDLLIEAGWTISLEEQADPDCGTLCRWWRALGLGTKPVVNVVRNAKGEKLEVEFLLDSEAFVRIAGPYVKSLRQIGVTANLRVVDQAQYQRRVKSFDFDITVERYSMQLTPGLELKTYWGSEAARTDGSFNLAGIADPVVDALAEKVSAAKSRSELVAATRAVDRVLRAGHYWVPHWYKAAHNLAFWDKLGWPAVKPKYDRGALATWWYDAAKAGALKGK